LPCNCTIESEEWGRKRQELEGKKRIIGKDGDGGTSRDH
jgi:hypothetical protein